ncbi:hypothetical protein [Seonamhaeicola marinus]|uniref:Tetratricopeptide repeat protein n=1 Tax=Seonamhaeicola marinus TaxID=1912246 RepID=A0A5D0HU12_9FLAO|nr:hypothetical protein [Seonamhaeicola marinus]TYA74883.1 hypothetical protein FUA24_16400 [Seonamhaeicola marinus]
MNSSDFINILQQPNNISHQQTDAIKSIIDEFPYFQSARAVYLKGLKDQSSFKYNQELKTTAAYTTDRSILFDFITSDVFIQNEISQFIIRNGEHLKQIDVDTEEVVIDKGIVAGTILQHQIEETEDTLDPSLFQPKTPISNKEASSEVEDTKNLEPQEKEEESPSKVLNIGQPLQFEKSETHSFNEWLKLTRFKPIEREEKQSKASAEQTNQEPKAVDSEIEKAKKFELIDKFISKNPKIAPASGSNKKVNLAKAQMIKPEALMTETLARIYVEQKNFKKAIQSYKILSLKYPEKSSFFANQIKAIEQLQKQNNKE